MRQVRLAVRICEAIGSAGVWTVAVMRHETVERDAEAMVKGLRFVRRGG